MSTLKTIYLVDDDEDWRFLLKEAINEASVLINVIEADNGQALFKILQPKANNPILVLDVNMPVMNGLEALQVLRNSSHWSTLPVYMVSSSSSPDLVLTAQQKGATKLVTKPTHFNEYVSLVKELTNYFNTDKVQE